MTLTPECLGSALPPLHADVHASGAPASDTHAIDMVAAASHRLLDACTPTKSGVPVDGHINPPLGSSPPMPATCSITLQPQGGFSSARLVILSCTGLAGVSVKPPYEDQLLGVGKQQTAEAVTWDFVERLAVAFGWQGTGMLERSRQRARRFRRWRPSPGVVIPIIWPCQ